MMTNCRFDVKYSDEARSRFPLACVPARQALTGLAPHRGCVSNFGSLPAAWGSGGLPADSSTCGRLTELVRLSRYGRLAGRLSRTRETSAPARADGRNIGYTPGMKTAVSIPDDVFAGAERLAHRTKRSRSEIYSAAVREYVARHSDDAVTEAMNAVIGKVDGTGADTFVSLAARNTLDRVEW